MVSKLEDKLLNLAEIFALIVNSSITLNQGSKLLTYSYWHFIRLFQKYRKVRLKNRFKLEKKSKPRKLSDNDKVLLKVYYLKLNKPQISLLHFFLRLDYPSFPVISQEW